MLIKNSEILGGGSMDNRSRWKRTSVVEQKPLTLKQFIHLMAATKNEQVSSLLFFFLACHILSSILRYL